MFNGQTAPPRLTCALTKPQGNNGQSRAHAVVMWTNDDAISKSWRSVEGRCGIAPASQPIFEARIGAGDPQCPSEFSAVTSVPDRRPSIGDRGDAWDSLRRNESPRDAPNASVRCCCACAGRRT
eukprot:scaffold184_cov316-Pinguiococcus_pyrenoidosus.AAC.54